MLFLYLAQDILKVWLNTKIAIYHSWSSGVMFFLYMYVSVLFSLSPAYHTDGIYVVILSPWIIRRPPLHRVTICPRQTGQSQLLQSSPSQLAKSSGAGMWRKGRHHCCWAAARWADQSRPRTYGHSLPRVCGHPTSIYYMYCTMNWFIVQLPGDPLHV